MYKEIIAQNTELCNQLISYTVEEKLDLLDTDNLEQSFRTRYANQLYIAYFAILKDLHWHNWQYLIDEFFENAYTINVKANDIVPALNQFYKSEITELQTFIADINKGNPKILTKATLYLNYLNEDSKRYRRCDCLLLLQRKPENYDSIAQLAKAKLKKEFVNIDKLDREQSDLFQLIDLTYLLGLLSNKNLLTKEDDIELFPSCFDFDYYKNPHIFAEFPKDKNNFHKLLKSWVMEQVEVRKNIFEWEEIPAEYQYILNYANNLLPQVIKEISAIESAVQEKLASPIDYPKHIFADEKAFILFNLLLRHLKSFNAVSFVYRSMAEKEKPPLIVVNDTPFRNWFNSMDYHIQLDNHTKTYENAKNEDRIAAFNIAKELFINH